MERWIGRYRVDELHRHKNVIIEINGDSVHGNPRRFGPSDTLQYGITAGEKWDRDGRRQSYLENRGFRVIVIWQSDNLQKKLDLVRMALRTSRR